MKIPFLFLWGFDSDGNLFLDAGFPILNNSKKEIENAQMLSMRQRFNAHLNMSLFHIPEGNSREFIEAYISIYNDNKSKEILNKLKKAKVSIREIIRTKEENNALDWIIHEN